jgi:signal recognition particle subunit SRP54
VNFKIAGFYHRVKENSKMYTIVQLQPGQLLVKLVKDELTELMGGDVAGINLREIYSYLDVGLQGSGKTTFPKTGQLSLKKNKKLLVVCDIYRPAAIQQLYVVGILLS